MILIEGNKWPTNLVIVRHGQSERNVAQAAAKAAGQKVSYAAAIRDMDTPLTALGMGQALSVGVELREHVNYPEFDVVFSSPYKRTQQTTAQILKGLGVDNKAGLEPYRQAPKVVLDERIRELEFGLMDGLTHEGMQAKYPEELARRHKEGKYWYRPPGGESRPDVAMRLQSFLTTLSRDYVDQRVLVVTHSVVVLMFRKLLERWDEAKYLHVDKHEDVKNCSITHYASDKNKLILQSYNSVCYTQ